jgi:hypothetical protein
MTRPLCRGLLLAVVTAAAGCQAGKPPYTFAPVEGTVRKDGQPLPGVVVIFWGDDTTKGPPSVCPTDSAGHFRLHTEKGQEGALVGRHRVCIVEAGATMQGFVGHKTGGKHQPKEPPAAGSSLVPPAYGRRDQTPLRAEVQAGGQVLDFEVK